MSVIRTGCGNHSGQTTIRHLHTLILSSTKVCTNISILLFKTLHGSLTRFAFRFRTLHRSYSADANVFGRHDLNTYRMDRLLGKKLRQL